MMTTKFYTVQTGEYHFPAIMYTIILWIIDYTVVMGTKTHRDKEPWVDTDDVNDKKVKQEQQEQPVVWYESFFSITVVADNENVIQRVFMVTKSSLLFPNTIDRWD